MTDYNLLVVCLIVMVGLAINAEWVEIPQFSNNKKIYRTSLQLDRLHQFSHDERVELKNVSRFKEAFDKRKILYEKHLIVNNQSVSSPFESTGSTQETSRPVITGNENSDQNEEFEDYYDNEGDDEKYIQNEEITTTETPRKKEMYTTCSTNELKMFTNTSGNYHEKPDLNEPKVEKEKNFLYYLPIKLFKRVHFILKSQPATLKGKIRFLKKIEKVLLSEVESRLAVSISPLTDGNEKKSTRQRRYDHHEDDVGFPSLEGALMAISFLTFAVYLVRLIMMLFQNMAPNTGTPTLLLGRNKRAMDPVNEDIIRILGYLNK